MVVALMVVEFTAVALMVLQLMAVAMVVEDMPAPLMAAVVMAELTEVVMAAVMAAVMVVAMVAVMVVVTENKYGIDDQIISSLFEKSLDSGRKALPE